MNDFWNNIIISILSSGLMTLILWFFVLKKLPEKVHDQVNQAMESDVLTINQYTDASNMGLKEGHNGLSGEHKEIKTDLRDLIADMNQRKGSATDLGDAIKSTEKMLATLMKEQNERANLNNQLQTMLEIKQQNKILINENDELKHQMQEIQQEDKVLKQNLNKTLEQENGQKNEITQSNTAKPSHKGMER